MNLAWARYPSDDIILSLLPPDNSADIAGALIKVLPSAYPFQVALSQYRFSIRF